MPQQQSEQWSSKLGVILAVAGSAIGFGNFLRFPGLAAQYGGGAFMIAYFCSLLLLGIPLCWIEWSLGRKGSKHGCHSPAAVYYAITRHRFWKFIGAISLLTPLTLGMYYLYIEGWTLGYCYNMLMGNFQADTGVNFAEFFGQFVGLNGNGSVYNLQGSGSLIFFLISLILNAFLIYRGVSKGIEWFCKWSMPVLILTSLIVLIRVLTLGTPDNTQPQRNIDAGLGYMWNPNKTILVAKSATLKHDTTLEMVPSGLSDAETQALIQRVKQETSYTELKAKDPEASITIVHISLIDGLLNPDLWLAAAGQIFFSLSVGFGTVLTYASYINPKEDIALSSLAANSANEFIEVSIAGMMIVPAAVSFLGVAAAAGASTFGLGFNVLPQVFASMPMGQFFGVLFFGLLYLAAVTSSISLMQPSIAFIEEFWGLRRRQSAILVTMLLGVGSLIVAWFTDELIALDTLDYFYGNLSLYICCTAMLIITILIWGTDSCIKELNSNGLIQIPRFMKYIMTWVTPSILIIIFSSWLYKNIFIEASPQIQNVLDLKAGAVIPLVWTLIVFLFFCFIMHSSKRFKPCQHVEQMSDTEDNEREIVS